MIGQQRLIESLKKYNINTFPHSLLIVGDSGSGKHTFTKEYISVLLGLECIDISEKISLETINEIILSPSSAIYQIDCDKVTVREQNIILKFLEEPLKKVFIVLYSTNKNLLLDTVINRCQVWYMDRYSEEELIQFSGDPEILEIAKTPGQIINFSSCNINAIKDLCVKLFKFGGTATTANILTIADKLNWKDDNTKFDLDVFNYFLIDAVSELLKTDSRYFSAYNLTKTLLNKEAVLHVDKRRLFEDFLVTLKYQLMGDLNGTT